MKKKLLWILLIICSLILVATIIGPGMILRSSRQPATDVNHAHSGYFRESYEDIRKHLREVTCELGVEIYSHAIDEEDDLYIDSFYLPGNKTQTNLIVLTTGVHGIEGYIGSAMLDVFLQEIYPTIDTDDTGILVVANVNPYGMKYFRRYNENNVDLNRNFILDWDSFDLSSNKEYPKVDTFLGPTGKIGNALWHDTGFYLSLGKTVITDGADTISDALLTGQYEYPRGVYYGGSGDEASTAYLKDVFSRCLDSDYENIIHIDIHSGYGSRYEMVIFNSVFETMTEAESKESFGYECVLAYDSEAFYATIGDTTDFFYRLAEKTQSDAELFSTCFEFGTLGDDFIATVQSLKYTIDENRNHWYPTDNATSAEIIRQNYMEMYYPSESVWREKAVENFITATTGILKVKLK